MGYKFYTIVCFSLVWRSFVLAATPTSDIKSLPPDVQKCLESEFIFRLPQDFKDSKTEYYALDWPRSERLPERARDQLKSYAQQLEIENDPLSSFRTELYFDVFLQDAQKMSVDLLRSVLDRFAKKVMTNATKDKVFPKEIEPDEKSFETKEMIGLGLGPGIPMEVAIYQELVKQKELSFKVENNYVIKLVFESMFFKKTSWKRTIARAREGFSPIGAKTYFPHFWSEKKIIEGLKLTLLSSSARIVKVKLKPKDNKIEYLVLEGIYDGVLITIEIGETGILAIYPSWHQELMYKTLREVLIEYKFLVGKIQNIVRKLPDAVGVSAREQVTLDDLVSIYLNERPNSKLRKKTVYHFSALLNPSDTSTDLNDKLTATGLNKKRLQHYISEYLMRQKLITDLSQTVTHRPPTLP